MEWIADIVDDLGRRELFISICADSHRQAVATIEEMYGVPSASIRVQHDIDIICPIVASLDAVPVHGYTAANTRG